MYRAMTLSFFAALLLGSVLGAAATAACFVVRNRSFNPAQTLIRWHRAMAKRLHAERSHHRGGRRPLDRDVITLIHRMRQENPTWRSSRIHSELEHLGICISRTTVWKYMRSAPNGGGSPGWAVFLRSHAAQIAAIDLLTVDTLTFDRLYAFVVLGLGRRRILHIEVTAHPTALWLANQLTEAFPWDTAPAWLVRDNDGADGHVFRRRVRAMGIRDKPITPYSPWQNGYAERLIGTIRRECLDHMFNINAAHLRRVLKRYADYYNNDRPHLGIGRQTPNGRAVEAIGEIIAEPGAVSPTATCLR